MKIKYLLIPILFWGQLFAQDFKELEQKLAYLGERSIMGITQEERLHSNAEFTTLLDSALQTSAGRGLQFKTVRNLSIQTSADNLVSIYTWLIPLKDGSYNHYGILCVNRKSGVEVVSLQDKSANQDRPEYIWGKPENWYGAIYYDIQFFKHKKNKYYLLFGYRPGDTKIQQKLLEVITIEDDRVKFGAKIFDTPKVFDRKYKQRPYRLVFSYNKKVVASVKWNESQKVIVMDHLSPPDASLMGQWEYYGPDFSYDGLFWEKGKFKLESDIKIKSDVNTVNPQSKPQQGLGEK